MKSYSAGSRADASDYSFSSTDAQITQSLDDSRSRGDVFGARPSCSYCSSTYFVSVDYTFLFVLLLGFFQGCALDIT